jgi:hypothetical protein
MASYSFMEGTEIRWLTTKPFTSITGTIVNPDVVKIHLSVQGQTVQVFTWTNGGSPPDPTSTIVNDSTGYFHADLTSAGLTGTWTMYWEGQPGISGLDSTRTSIVSIPVVAVITPVPF